MPEIDFFSAHFEKKKKKKNVFTVFRDIIPV